MGEREVPSALSRLYIGDYVNCQRYVGQQVPLLMWRVHGCCYFVCLRGVNSVTGVQLPSDLEYADGVVFLSDDEAHFKCLLDCMRVQACL